MAGASHNHRASSLDVPVEQPGGGSWPELTIRGIILGGLITLLFTAANVYLGLKAGLTFATSIPAAVISMAVLRMFRNANILENNIVQTIASAAGTLSASRCSQRRAACRAPLRLAEWVCWANTSRMWRA